MQPVITWVDEALSTNSLLASLCDSLPHGAVVAARTQTAGRGQRGNSWESEPNANLTFSMLLRPHAIAAAAQFELSMIVALAICDALTAASGLQFSVKWPNDIYIGDKKICGILIENSLKGSRIGRSIVGIGINVNQQTFFSDAPNPVSLSQLTLRQYNLDTLLCDVCSSILFRFDEYEDHPHPDRLTSEYRNRLWRGSGFHLWTDCKSAQTFEAEIADVATNGILTLKDRDGHSNSFAFKEVAAVL